MRFLLAVAKFTFIIPFNTAAHQEEKTPLGALKNSASILKTTFLEHLYMDLPGVRTWKSKFFSHLKYISQTISDVPAGFIDPHVFKKQMVIWI